MKRLVFTFGFLALNSLAHGALGKDSRNKHALSKSPGRSLSTSLGSPSRSIKADLQAIFDFFDSNEIDQGCRAADALLKNRLLNSEELAHLRSALSKQSSELFELAQKLQEEVMIIEDLKNKKSHVKIEALTKIQTLGAEKLAQFSVLSFKEIDFLTQGITEDTNFGDVLEPAHKARIVLSHAALINLGSK